MFCPKCGSLILPKKERNKVVVKCNCGYKETKESGSTTLSEKSENEDQIIEVIENENQEMPVCKEHCEKCGNDEAYYHIKQTRSADESPTKFMKCTKCGFTWRDTD